MIQVCVCPKCQALCTDAEWNTKTKACRSCSSSKYRNRKTSVGDLTFASQKEAARYNELLRLQRAGTIHSLSLQPCFPLVVQGRSIAKYYGDFRYITVAGETIIEDVKGMRTAVYQLKKKLVEALYPITIREV